MKDKDLYAALGVARGASADEIRKSYRKLARKHHPDVNPGNRAAEERFKEISEANDILGDPAKRKLYDEFGMAGVQSGFDAGQARAYREQAANWERAGAATGGRGGGGFGGYSNFEDVFGDIFDRGGGFEAGPQRGGDAETEIEIDLLDAVRGLSTTIAIQRPETCPTCKGDGAEPGSGSTCTECSGSGRVRVGQGPVAFTRACPRCHGVGRVSVRPCATCSGSGQRVTTERLNVRIPAGVDTGSRVRVAGKGGAGGGGANAGDLFIRVKVRPHPLLERRGNDLYMDLPVKVGEAMLGASIEVPTADGAVRVRVPPDSQTGRLLRVKQRGVPPLRGGERGDLYLRLMVHVPEGEAAAAAAAEAVRAVDAAYPRSPREGLRL